MAISVNESGTIVELTNVYANESGTVKEHDTVYANENGALKVIHEKKIFPTNLTWTAVSPASFTDVGGDGMASLKFSLNSYTGDSSIAAGYVASRSFNVSAGASITITISSSTGGNISNSPQYCELVQIKASNGTTNRYVIESNLLVDSTGASVTGTGTFVYTFKEAGLYELEFGGYAVYVPTSSGGSVSYGTKYLELSISFS